MSIRPSCDGLRILFTSTRRESAVADGARGSDARRICDGIRAAGLPMAARSSCAEREADHARHLTRSREKVITPENWDNVPDRHGVRMAPASICAAGRRQHAIYLVPAEGGTRARSMINRRLQPHWSPAARASSMKPKPTFAPSTPMGRRTA